MTLVENPRGGAQKCSGSEDVDEKSAWALPAWAGSLNSLIPPPGLVEGSGTAEAHHLIVNSNH